MSDDKFLKCLFVDSAEPKVQNGSEEWCESLFKGPEFLSFMIWQVFKVSSMNDVRKIVNLRREKTVKKSLFRQLNNIKGHKKLQNLSTYQFSVVDHLYNPTTRESKISYQFPRWFLTFFFFQSFSFLLPWSDFLFITPKVNFLLNLLCCLSSRFFIFPLNIYWNVAYIHSA